MRLPNSEWLPHAPDEPGTIRINHVSHTCSGDSKSLKITRTDDDRVYAKCYRCGGFGSDAGRMAAVGSVAKHLRPAVVRVGSEVKFPTDFTNDFNNFPVEVRSYLKKVGIDSKIISQYGMGWSPHWERFILPVYKGTDLIGFQARYFGTDDQPKYITRYKESGDLWQVFPARSSRAIINMCVIVEDMFSAVRVAEHFDAVCMYGTEMSDKCLYHVANNYEHARIWTDYDNFTVRKKGVKILNRLTMAGVRGKILASVTDPKHYTSSEIEGIILDTLPS